MARFTDVMTADGGDAGVFKPGDVTPTSGLMSSLGALNVLAGLKADAQEPVKTTIVDEQTKAAGARAAAATQKTASATAQATGDVVASALRKLQSGQTLTDAEKKLLGITATTTAQQTTDDVYATKIVKDGLTQAQIDALEGQKTASAAAKLAEEAKANAAKITALVDRYKKGEKLTAEELALINLTPQGTVKTVTPSGGNEGPGKQPGAAWILSPDGKSWIKPAQPNPTDTWNDEKGWVPAGKTGEGPGKQPGKAWVLSADGKSWVKPTMPTDGKTYTWNDETGWTAGTTPPPGGDADYKEVNGVLMYKGAPHNGMYNGKEYVNGKVKTDGAGVKHPGYWTDPTSGLLYNNDVLVEGDYNGYKYKAGIVTGTAGGKVGGNYGGSGTADDPFTENGLPFTGTMFGSTYKNGVIVNTAGLTADSIAKQARLDARTEFGNTLKSLGLPQDLVDAVDELIKQDFTKSQMYLELIKSKPYKDRFPGMDALRAAGKAVSEGEYISAEKGFLQTLQYYGLDKNIFGTTAELGKYIGGLTSPKEFEDRVALAAQDVEQNPDVLAELNLYYGVDKSAAITYLLNPTIGLDIIKRQARAAEIGAMAAKSKFDFGQTKEGYGVAESFINAAGTMDLQSLSTTFQQARQLAGNQTRLAQLEGASYNDLEAVSAILGKDQAAVLDSQRRAAREAARFGGSSGLSSGSLKQETSI